MSFEDLGSLRIKFSGDDLACLWLGFERAENMNVMREKLSQWEYLKQMPDEISGFIKKLPETFEVDGTCVPIFTYVLPSKYCRIEGYFDQSTDDFMVHCFIGLHVFHDIRFICKKMEEFQGRLDSFLVPVLCGLVPDTLRTPTFFVNKKKLVDWQPMELSSELHGVSLFIKPPCFLQTINGAVVVIDYSDFSGGHQWVLYFNGLRDEFYAEQRLNGVLERISTFDCKGLEDLDALLPEIENTLRELRSRV